MDAQQQDTQGEQGTNVERTWPRAGTLYTLRHVFDVAESVETMDGRLYEADVRFTRDTRGRVTGLAVTRRVRPRVPYYLTEKGQRSYDLARMREADDSATDGGEGARAA